MSSFVPSMLRVLQPPYGWILLVILAMPFWVLFASAFMRGFRDQDQGSLFWLKDGRLKPIRMERDLARYASLLTATWLLIITFKVYQQYFVSQPLAHTSLGAFDLGLGLFSMASWGAMLMLRTQERL
ncbi:MAG: hypothetical protein ACLFWD_02710 [Anaerolineales bacterium]